MGIAAFPAGGRGYICIFRTQLIIGSSRINFILLFCFFYWQVLAASEADAEEEGGPGVQPKAQVRQLLRIHGDL